MSTERRESSVVPGSKEGAQNSGSERRTQLKTGDPQTNAVLEQIRALGYRPSTQEIKELEAASRLRVAACFGPRESK